MPDINKAYSWAIQTCNAPNVGYSQRYRNQQTINGITYYDCSSFINYALIMGGFVTPAYAPTKNAFTTSTEISELLRLGFVEVDASGEYMAGDIGWNLGHTEMCYSGGIGSGRFMGAHTDNLPLAEQVSISTFTTSFTRLFRYGSGGVTGYGSSVYVISALFGNSWVESHCNPGQGEIGGGGFGLFQWTGTRRTALLEWLSENGFETTDGNGQCQYLVHEDDWSGTFGGISSLEEFLTSESADINMLTQAFMECWERPGVPNLEERLEYAYKGFTYITEHANDTSITDWIVKDTLLTEEEALHNAVLLFRYFGAGGGGGGTPGTSKKGLPIWMQIRYR